MLRIKHLVRAGGLIVGLALGNVIASLNPGALAPAYVPPLSEGQLEGVRISSDGVIGLHANAEPAPQVYGSYAQFGLYTSPTQHFSLPSRTFNIAYESAVPRGSALRVDVRTSLDGIRWQEWEPGLANGSWVTFDTPGRFAQYRVTLLGDAQSKPQIQNVQLMAWREPGIPRAQAEEPPPVAPTFRIHGTRMGMVGGRTANGHRITPRDHFVSLPSWRSLSSKGGNEYMVRITYNGRSSVAPVYDVGPWNVRDNYWDVERERYKDLERGYPQDHAAYFDNYNGGWAEKGKVRFPTAIDVGDGVWWDDLGIKGDRAILEVTFLWLGTDPLAEPTPEPEATVDSDAEQPPAEPSAEAAPAPAEEPGAEAVPTPAEPSAEASPAPAEEPTAAPPPPEPTASPPPPEPPPEQAPAPPEPTPEPTAAPPEPTPEPTAAPAPPEPTPEPVAEQAVAPTAVPIPSEIIVDNRDDGFTEHAEITWYHSDNNCGYGDDALWTYSTNDPDSRENHARWQPNLPVDGQYELYAFVPDCSTSKSLSTSAHYTVQHRDGKQQVVIDQAAAAGTWVLLGRFTFSSGSGSAVELHDLANDAMNVLWFDAVKWVHVP